MKKEKKLTKCVTVIDGFELDECTVNNIINRLEKIKVDYPNISKLKLVNIGYDSDNFNIEGLRLETDAEYNKRIQKNKKRAATVKENELKQLAKLKAKYEA